MDNYIDVIKRLEIISGYCCANRDKEALDAAIRAVNTVLAMGQPENCPLYGGVCGYPIENCPECPRHKE